MLKAAVGQCALSVAERLPSAKALLRRIGLRTSQDLFGKRSVTVQLGDGREFRLTHVDESYLAFQLFWRGGDYYEPITRALLQVLVQPGARFLDIGAHIGFFSMAIGRAVPGVSIIAFEPHPGNFQVLKANAASNGLKNMVCEPVAISDQDGTGTLYLTESDMSASLMKDFQEEDTEQISNIEVPTVTLDTYLSRRRITGPMVVKVDIEGHEPAFFRGASETLARHRPDIVLEVLYDQDPTLVSHLKDLGYHFYPVTDEGLVELDAPRLVKRFPFLFLNHWLSVRPKQEVAEIFARVQEATRRIDLLQTSKHFP